jgi:hypothetical protein
MSRPSSMTLASSGEPLVFSIAAYDFMARAIASRGGWQVGHLDRHVHERKARLVAEARRRHA